MSSQYQLQHPRKSLVVNTCVFLSLSSLLLIGKGHNLAGAFLLLPSLFLAFPVKKSELPRNFWILSCLFCLFVLVSIISFFIKGGELSDIDQPSRFFISIFIILMLIKYPPKFKWIMSGVITSSIVSFIVAIIQIQHYGVDRAFSGDNSIPWLKGYMPIQDGGIAMTMGLFCACFFIHFLKRKNHKLSLFSSIGFICGISASLMSGSRGAWIALPLILLYLIYSNRTFFKNKVTIIISVVIFLSLAYTALQSPKFIDRINDASHDIQKLEDGNPESSLGIRITLWKSALLATKEHPIFGSGYPDRIQIRKEQIDSGVMPTILNKWLPVHSHNQYLEYLSVYGLIGLSILLCIFLYPLYILKKFISDSDEEDTLRQCGIIHILATMTYCLTQAFFAHNSGAIFYPIVLSLLLVASGTIKLSKVKKYEHSYF